jgi:hypothetical protein
MDCRAINTVKPSAVEGLVDITVSGLTFHRKKAMKPAWSWVFLGVDIRICPQICPQAVVAGRFLAAALRRLDRIGSRLDVAVVYPSPLGAWGSDNGTTMYTPFDRL